MRELKKEEMKSVEAGASALVISSIVGVIVTFFIGALRGYSNPESCRN